VKAGPTINRITKLALATILTGSLFCPEQVCAQGQQQTVGDGTLFLYSPGRAESYGIGSGDIAPITNYSRTNAGASTGIGSSSLQTTAPTGETRPSANSSISSPSAFGSNLSSASLLQNNSNPALGGYLNTSSFGGNYSSGFGSNYANFASGTKPFSYASLSAPLFSGSLVSPFAAPGFSQDLNSMPSFSRRNHMALPMNSGGEDQLFNKIAPHF
jgi:hypothetical protein